MYNASNELDCIIIEISKFLYTLLYKHSFQIPHQNYLLILQHAEI